MAVLLLRRGAGCEHAVYDLSGNHGACLAVEYQAILHVVHEPGIYVITAIFFRSAVCDGNGVFPAVCKLTDVDPDTGCKEFEIEKGRFSFRLTAPYREERRRAASEAAKNE